MPLQRRIDTDGWGPWSVKEGVLYAHAPTRALEQIVALRVHLDDSGKMNGPLRVLPETHTRGVLTDEEIQKLSASISPVDCLACKGSVIAMRPLIVHASSKSFSAEPRRVLHIEYAAAMEIDGSLEIATA
jgi:ectoine hydroxylase-related dioxygenase (phytanoyl-CoA dioxygenase family)